MHLIARVTLAALLSAALTACAATTGSAPTVPPASGNGGGFDGFTQAVTLGAQPTTVAIPTVANITGSIVFPAVSMPASLVLSASTTAPDGVTLQSMRTAQRVHAAQSAGTLTVYDYVTLTPLSTIVFSSIPPIRLTFPSSTPVSGESFYYGISDPNAQGGSVSFDTQGPVQSSANSVVFPAVATPLTLLAGHAYTFIVYATTTAAPAAPKIFVANAGNDTVTSYMLDGTQTTPTIHAGLKAPSSIAVDANGKIYVLNAGTDTITTYTPGGTQTTPTITTGLNGAIAVGVDATGKIYALNYNNYVVTTYTKDGAPATPTITGLNQPSAMAVDAAGEVYITNFGYRTFDSGVTTYNPDGSLGKVRINSAYLQPEFIAIGGGAKVYVAYQIPGILVAYAADGSISPPSINISTPDAFAVDTAGKIYGTNPLTNTVSTIDANGLPTTPTITAGIDKPSAITVR